MKPKAIRGMNDILPAVSGTWRYLETEVRELIESYGYREIRLPVGRGVAGVPGGQNRCHGWPGPPSRPAMHDLP